MTILWRLTAVAALAFGAVGGVLAQGRLVGVNGSTVYEIDMATAGLTQLGTLTGTGIIGELSYDWDNHVLYMISSQNQNLMTLDLETMTHSIIGAFGLGTNPIMHGLEVHGPSGKLYAMSGGSAHGYHLYDLNKASGGATYVGTSSLTSFHNLGFNSLTGVMYMTNSNTDSLYTIDLSSGASTLIGPLAGSTNPNGLAFNHHTGTMYLVDNSTDNLYTLNLSTGEATVVGSLGSSNFLSLAYVPEPVPEPATMLALGAGLLALSRRRKRAA